MTLLMHLHGWCLPNDNPELVTQFHSFSSFSESVNIEAENVCMKLSAEINTVFNTPCPDIKRESIISLDLSISAHLRAHPKWIRLEERKKPHGRYKRVRLKIDI